MIRDHLRRTLVAFAIPAFVAGAAAPNATADDPSVTVVTRPDGERVTGRFEDIANGTVYIRVSLHDQRRIPLDDIMVIDFVGDGSALPPTETREAQSGSHLVVYRGGASSRGQLVGVDPEQDAQGREQTRNLIFRTERGEEQRVPLTRVGRLYLGSYRQLADNRTDAPVGTSGTSGGANPFVVSGARQWTPTGIRVRQGDRVRFSATGQITLSDAQGDVATPAGAVNGRTAAGSPAPNVLAGALIGRVGNSRAFGIGTQLGALPMPESGELWLGVNDNVLADNVGEFRVEVSVQGQSQAEPRRSPR